MDGTGIHVPFRSPSKSMSRMVVIALQVFAWPASDVRKRALDLVAEKDAVRHRRSTREQRIR